jgi:hypothetical protein
MSGGRDQVVRSRAGSGALGLRLVHGGIGPAYGFGEVGRPEYGHHADRGGDVEGSPARPGRHPHRHQERRSTPVHRMRPELAAFPLPVIRVALRSLRPHLDPPHTPVITHDHNGTPMVWTLEPAVPTLARPDRLLGDPVTHADLATDAGPHRREGPVVCTPQRASRCEWVFVRPESFAITKSRCRRPTPATGAESLSVEANHSRSGRAGARIRR